MSFGQNLHPNCFVSFSFLLLLLFFLFHFLLALVYVRMNPIEMSLFRVFPLHQADTSESCTVSAVVVGAVNSDMAKTWCLSI